VDVGLAGEDGAQGRDRELQVAMPADQLVGRMAAGLLEEVGVVAADTRGEAGAVEPRRTGDVAGVPGGDSVDGAGRGGHAAQHRGVGGHPDQVRCYIPHAPCADRWRTGPVRVLEQCAELARAAVGGRRRAVTVQDLYHDSPPGWGATPVVTEIFIYLQQR
jgi:hypothetical protein